MKLVSSTLLFFSCFAFATASIDLDGTGQYRCSFDNDVCDWRIEGPIGQGPGGCDFDWPDNATHGVTGNGGYACFFLELLPPGTNSARLTSPTINTTQQVVMSFAVGTVRPPTGPYLNVILVNETGTETLLCSTSDHLFPWQRIYVGVVQSGPYKIVIEGVPNPPFLPNFGIDDFTLTVVENATAALGVEITDRCSTEIVTTVSMSSSSYNATHPMTISQNTSIHFESTTGSEDTTILPMTSREDTTILAMTSRHDTTMLPITSSHDTTIRPMTSSEDTTILPMTSSHDTTIRPMTSSEDTTILPVTSGHGTTTLHMTSSHDTTILPMTSSHDTTILPIKSSHDTTINIIPMTSSHDTTILPMTSDHGTAILPMTGSPETTTFPMIMTSSKDETTFPMTSRMTFSKSSSEDTTTMSMASSQDTSATALPMTSKQEETTHIVSNMPTTKTTDHFITTSSQDKTTSGFSKNPTSKTPPPEETTKPPIPSKTLLTTSKSGEAATKPLPTSTPSKDGQLGQQSGRTGQPDITALPIVLGIAVFLLIAAGAMFYLRKKRKRSSFSVEESRRASRMTLTQTELTEF